VIVIEASAMVNALVAEPADARLLALLADADLHAPTLLDFEVASALRGHAMAGKIDERRLEEAVEDFGAFTIERYHMTNALGRILDLRDNFGAYDAAYVVLAHALNAPLVTCDAIMRESSRLGVDVRLHPANGA
jgi:predicted nucleic acid-binding protein